MAVLIKRYINRKFYDTYHKRYITLKGIGNLLGIGEDIQVVDHVTGEDITEIILRKVIFQLDGTGRSKFHQTGLRQMIRKCPGMTSGVLGYCFDCYITALDDIESEMRKRFVWLVERGELTWQQAEELIHQLSMPNEYSIHNKYSILQIIRNYIQYHLASRDQIQQLSLKVDALANEVEKLIALK